jgi:hypothetical protein
LQKTSQSRKRKNQKRDGKEGAGNTDRHVQY